MLKRKATLDTAYLSVECGLSSLVIHCISTIDYRNNCKDYFKKYNVSTLLCMFIIIVCLYELQY